jgi:sRNA-binding regulator protein Hfq
VFSLINFFMADSSHIPAGNVRELHSGFSRETGREAKRGQLRSMPTAEVSAVPAPDASLAQENVLGPRKLVRPKLPAGMVRERSFSSRSDSPMLTHQAPVTVSHEDQAAWNAETFYFQKQVQTQTLMVFVLEDGEQVQGYIEWYDRNAIKVRNGSRTLIYKSAIKYLYKAGEKHGEAHTSGDGCGRIR